MFSFLASTAQASTTAATRAPWQEKLQRQLAAIDASYPGELGVYVKDVSSGLDVSLRADEPWYLASGVKIPVAVELLRQMADGRYTLETKVELQPQDYVDGAGQTNWHAPGSRLSIRYLLEQMLIYSDNTASDVLIRLVGIDRVNALVQSHATDFAPITTLADVRRHVYSYFHENAFGLTSADLFALKKQRNEVRRVEVLAQRLKVKPAAFSTTTIDDAFAAYYAGLLNSAPLRSYGRFLEKALGGNLLAPTQTAHLVDVMTRVETGKLRVRAGLGSEFEFAHKTGTQYKRQCDFGMAWRNENANEVADGKPRRVLIAVCSRNERSVARAEAAMRAVGKAVSESGVFTEPN